MKRLGFRTGNWLNREQARWLLEKSDGDSLRSIRDVAMISILLGCGLRRAELSSLRKEDTQVRQGHWAIVDLVGKGKHVRTVPMPIWVKDAVDRWLTAASVATGRVQSRESARNTLRNRHFRERGLVCDPELCPAPRVRSPRTA